MRSSSWFNNARITDDGPKDLNGLTELSQLHLEDTEVTYDEVSKLKEALPNCKVVTQDDA